LNLLVFEDPPQLPSKQTLRRRTDAALECRYCCRCRAELRDARRQPASSSAWRRTRTIARASTTMPGMPQMLRITCNGPTLHGGPLPGYAASHGCVRMPFGFAEKLFDKVRIGTPSRRVTRSRSSFPIRRCSSRNLRLSRRERRIGVDLPSSWISAAVA
jgi:hypothetical protein